MEARCQQAEEQAEKKEQELRSQVTSLEEATLQSENQVKELKETIFELEDQVEQHRAVNCHTNQAVLDMESMSLPVWCIVGNIAFIKSTSLAPSPRQMQNRQLSNSKFAVVSVCNK